MRFSIVALVCGCAMLIAASAHALLDPSRYPGNVVRARVVNLRNSDGQVACSLHNTSATFPHNPDQSLARILVPVKNDEAVCEFAGVPPATYAVAAFHDENSNNKMDRYFFGMPREGVGFSNVLRVRLSAPGFGESSFAYESGTKEVVVYTNYLGL